MGSIEERRRETRQRAIEELRCNRAGALIQIIERLEGMDLSIAEIDAILKMCGFDEDCAVGFGTSVRIEKEKGLIKPDNTIHP